MRKFFIINFNNGPWGGPWSGNSGDSSKSKVSNDSKGQKTSGGENNNNENNNNKKNNKPEKNLEEFFKNFIQKIENFFKDKKSQNDQNPTKSTIGILILGLILFWLSLGFYKVDPDENAVTLYFGKFYKISQPGLNYHVPYPFGQVIKKSVTTVNTEEFGFSSISGNQKDRNLSAESLMLTGDENIVDVQFQVQWQVSDIRNFVFNIAEPNQSIRKSAESAMREIIAKAPIAQALSDGKQKIEQETKILLQEILDSYDAGIRIVLVQLRRVDPPEQVIDAFRDVQTAKADKEKEINESQAYANDIIPRARGAASKIKEESEAYASQVVANAKGEASRFLSVYGQYVKAKQVTKKRIYLETMEKLYRDIDKIYIDKSASKSMINYIPIHEVSKKIPQTEVKK